MSNPHEWLAKLTTDSQNESARKAGIAERTLYHQLSRGSLSVDNILKLAAAYDVHPIRALIETGCVDRKWETAGDVEAALRKATPEQLADAMLSRIAEAESRSQEKPTAFTTPVDDLSARYSENKRSNELRSAKSTASNTPGVSPVGDDDDALIDRINSGQERIAAQKRTDPLDENYT